MAISRVCKTVSSASNHRFIFVIDNRPIVIDNFGGQDFREIMLLRWLEIVSWRAQPGPLIARARASTPGSRRSKFSDLVPSKILQNLYFDQQYL